MEMTELLKKLECPKGKIDVVLDTDTYNEIDDQFALSYMIKSDDKLDVKAIYAAPFFNEKSTGPADGMEKSYHEILKVLDLLGRNDLKQFVFRGANTYMPSEDAPVLSDAAKDLAERAMGYTSEKPLYVVAIGAITNVASALVMKPEIRERIVVVWLGGHAHHWPENTEFNLYQDVASARVIFGCGVPLVQLPCMGVVSAFTVSKAELEYHLLGKNKLCDYLVQNTIEEVKGYCDSPVWSRVIWDVTAVAWLVSEEFMNTSIVHSPIPEYDGRYAFDARRHFMKYVYYIDRDKLLRDLFEKLER